MQQIVPVKKFEITFDSQLKSEFKGKFKYNSLKEIINDSEFINGSHLVYGATKAGKTLFTTLLVRNLIELYPNKFGIIVLSRTQDIFLKFAFIEKYFKNSFNIDKIIQFNNLNDLKVFYSKLVKEKNRKIANRVKNTNQEKKVIVKEDTTHLALIIDDFADSFCDFKNKKFYNILCTQNRHTNITMFYLVQMIHNFIQSIKGNTSSVTLIGQPTAKECGILHSGYSSVSNMFDSASKFIKFINLKNSIFSTGRTVITFKKNSPNSKRYIYYYEVSSQLAKKMDEYEKEIKD